MKVLGLASYPVEAAATRFRLMQFVAPLADRGIILTVHPFLSSELFTSFYRRDRLALTVAGILRCALGRLHDVWLARSADVLLVQREAMLFGPPVIEWLSQRLAGCPMVLDLDDATYIPYRSPVFGDLPGSRTLKWFGKTDELIRWSRVVTCGNRVIADYVSARGKHAEVLPTIVDTELFRPAQQKADTLIPVIGWIGTHSTYPFLESIYPALQRLASSHRFRLRVIGSGKADICLPGVDVECLPWTLKNEISDFQSLDIGLYPLLEDDRSVAKSGFKSIQYMAVGLPFVVTPLGACADIGEPGVTHMFAKSQEDWVQALTLLLSRPELRRQMGQAGREHAIEHYSLPLHADKLTRVLFEAAV